MGLPSIPEGDWHCQYCQNLHQRERSVASNDNAIAAGRVAGVDPIEQIFKRSIRIVTSSQADVGGCAVCRFLLLYRSPSFFDFDGFEFHFHRISSLWNLMNLTFNFYSIMVFAWLQQAID